MRAWASPFAAALLLLAIVPAAPTASADGCTSGAPPAWFLGVVYSTGMEDWAKGDVRHFERYLAALRQVYCIPSSSGKILAFWNDYTANGKVYEAGTEANVKAYLAQFGAAAQGVPDAHFFFALSSHGIMNVHSCPDGGPTRLGSISGLRSGGGEDGTFKDCELGQALNARFPASTRMWVFVDCSFCGGFSDSLTAASGTIPDLQAPRPSGVVAPGRVVVTGCAITTECFGSSDGSITHSHLTRILQAPMSACDGWTAPGFPLVQGIDAPAQIGDLDGRCTMSEWFYAAVNDAYVRADAIGIQQQFRMKWGLADLADDILLK